MDTLKAELTYTLDDIGAAAREFWQRVSDYSILAFSGEMGAGKTTFIHYLCDFLQVEDAVSSPTFALVNEYHFKGKDNKDTIIFHMDWYRVKSEEEAMQAGMEDCMIQARANKGYCFIEWPERAPALLDKPYVMISITSTDITERKMSVTLVN
jgi:tRNA threonylcarbamoyladenosine biosynthesis protein TsaE